MFADAPFYDVCDVLQGWRVLLEHVVTQGNIVGQCWLITHYLHRCGKLLTGRLILLFL